MNDEKRLKAEYEKGQKELEDKLKRLKEKFEKNASDELEKEIKELEAKIKDLKEKIEALETLMREEKERFEKE